MWIWLVIIGAVAIGYTVILRLKKRVEERTKIGPSLAASPPTPARSIVEQSPVQIAREEFKGSGLYSPLALKLHSAFWAVDKMIQPVAHPRDWYTADPAGEAYYQESIAKQQRAYHGPESVNAQKDAYLAVLRRFKATLPTFLHKDTIEAGLSIPILEVMDDPMPAIRACIEPFSPGVFMVLRKTFSDNEAAIDEKKIKGATKQGLVRTYLKDTPFLALFDERVPFDLGDRMEHHWLLAPPGSGKTQTLQYFIAKDLEAVQANRATVLVMDSSGDLIENISHLSLFKSHPEKLLVIEPANMVPINLFSMGREHRTSEASVNNTRDLLLYCFNSLMGAELTAKQTALIGPILRVCMEIPNATLDTIRDFLVDNHVQYQEYIDRAGPVTAEFFGREYGGKKDTFSSTKDEVDWRLNGFRDSSVFQRLFSKTPSTFSFHDALNSASCILINTDRQLLGDQLEMFGRVWIALLLQASQQRSEIHRGNRLPTYCYIDEVQEYVKDDTKIARILDQARKMNIGLILAHQRTDPDQISTNVLSAISNSGIRMSRATIDNFVARALISSPEFINNQPDMHFATYVRGKTKQAVSIAVPFLYMEKMPHMEEHEYREIVQTNWAKYQPTPEAVVQIREVQLPSDTPKPDGTIW